ncbi:MAG: YlbF family regulator [Thermincola sp.]|jgi:cell fate (sporulation/competence/biofilm development) regulator YlbF (YheA/YmcA/DUF963 family)|nr:YlbF family regulator [Thermincola sp.]MDT3702111.1 YlbF family regulator [Thermincola sp.]
MNLNDKAKDFTDAIKKTREYIELKQAHSIINKNSGLKKKADEIKKKQHEILVNYKSGQKNQDPKILELSEELKRVMEIPELNRYFIAGNNFHNMMSKIYMLINEAIESDLKNS